MISICIAILLVLTLTSCKGNSEDVAMNDTSDVIRAVPVTTDTTLPAIDTEKAKKEDDSKGKSDPDEISDDESFIDEDREPKSDKGKNEKTKYDTKVDKYYLGLSVSKLKSKLEEDEYKITLPPDYDEGADQYGNVEDPIKDGRIYQHDGGYLFYTKHLSFNYNPNNKNYRITVNTKKYKTNEGIKVGDSKQDMIDKYGKEYKKSGKLYLYHDGKTYLSFGFEKDKIKYWEISPYHPDYDRP